MSINIAIDGPAGAGKSTIARKLAQQLSYIYVDTGAMYRAMALYFIENQITAEDEAAISSACQGANISIVYENGEQQVILNGRNVNSRIRTEEVSNMTSATSIYPEVRHKLVELQQELAKKSNVIMDGRDIGTCVLPDAQVKIFLTASTETRAKRRCEELTAKGMTCDVAEIEQNIKERDYRDMNRALSPLRQAEDAVLVDSSQLDIDAVIDEILKICQKKGIL